MGVKVAFDEAAVVDLAQADPHGVIDTAERIERASTSTARERVVAQWARGLALRELDDLAGAERSLVAAHTSAAADDDVLAARITVSLALVVMYQGDSARALAALESAEPHLTGVERGKMLLQRGLVRHRTGDLVGARADYEGARGVLDEVDPVSALRLAINLAVLDVYEGQPDVAVARLQDAPADADDIGQPLLGAFAEHNLGYAFAACGDVVEALRHYDIADERYARLTDSVARRAVVAADRSVALLGADLLVEADEASSRAVADLQLLGDSADLAEAALLAARVRCARGDVAGAREAATIAGAAFADAGRASWSPLVELLLVEAEAIDGARGTELARRAELVAADLATHRWFGDGARALLLSGRLYLAAGDTDDARRALGSVMTDTVSTSPIDRTAYELARGLLAEADGDRAAARRCVTRGLAALSGARAAVAHIELRAHAIARAEEIGALGVRLAIEDGRPRELIRRVETTRRISSVPPAVRAPTDPVAAELSTELRWVAGRIREAAGDDARLAALVERQQWLEREIVRVARLREGSGGATRPDVPAVLGAMDGWAVAEFVEADASLWVATVVDDRAALTRVGDATSHRADVDGLTFAVNRLQRDRQSARSSDAARLSMTDSAGRLGALLPDRVMGRPLVIVPSPSLTEVCWRPVVPAAGQPVVVAPSLLAWDAARRGSSTGHRSTSATASVFVASGPDLAHAAREAEAVAAVHGSTSVTVEVGADGGRVLEMLGRCDVAHLACHGRFRSDNPLFSTLRWVDGDLTIYDLEQCERLPHTIVMSACNAGQNAVLRGGALLGMTSALIQLGVSTVIAPLTPVNDERSVDLMVRLHTHLAAGVPAAEALAVASIGPDGALDPTAAPFVCFGS